MAEEGKLVSAHIIPPEPRELRVPPGTPLGLGILGAARFSALRRIFEHAERAARAKAGYHNSLASMANARIAEEAAFEQLNHLDAVRRHTADRIHFAYEEQRRNEAAARRAEAAAIEADEIAALRRKLDRMEVEEEFAARRAKRANERATAAAQASGATSREDALTSWLGRVPDFVKKAEAAKEEITRDAGGDEHMTDGQRAIIDTIDAIVQAVLSKKVEDTAL